MTVLKQSHWHVILVLLLAVLIRWAGIDTKEVWFDEAMTWHYASLPWSEISNYIGTHDVHPPLHFYFTKLFLGFGDGAVALRIGPAILEVAALPLVYFAAYQLAPAKRAHAVALLAMVLAALSANLIATGQLARAYAGIYFAFTLCFAALSWIASHPEAARASVFSGNGAKARVAFGALATGLAAMPWLHNLGLLYAVAVGVIAFAIWLTVLKRQGAAFGNFAAAAVLAALLYLPQLPTLLRQLEPVTTSYWIEAPTLRQAIRGVLELFGQMQFDSAAGIAMAVFICAAGLWAVISLIRQGDLRTLILTAGMLALVYGLFVLVTYGAKPVMLKRAMVPMLGPWFVLMAFGLCSIAHRTIRRALVIAITATMLFQSVQGLEATNWRSKAVAFIAANSETVPTIVTVPNAASILMEYHAAQLGIDIKTIPLPAAFPDHGDAATYPTGWPGVTALSTKGIDELDSRLAGQTGDLWVYLRAYWIYDPEALLKPFLDRDYCYQPIDTPEKLYMVFKLSPRAGLAADQCDDMGTDTYFPYDRPKYGRFALDWTQ